MSKQYWNIMFCDLTAMQNPEDGTWAEMFEYDGLAALKKMAMPVVSALMSHGIVFEHDNGYLKFQPDYHDPRDMLTPEEMETFGEFIRKLNGTPDIEFRWGK